MDHVRLIIQPSFGTIHFTPTLGSVLVPSRFPWATRNFYYNGDEKWPLFLLLTLNLWIQGLCTWGWTPDWWKFSGTNQSQSGCKCAINCCKMLTLSECTKINSKIKVGPLPRSKIISHHFENDPPYASELLLGVMGFYFSQCPIYAPIKSLV